MSNKKESGYESAKCKACEFFPDDGFCITKSRGVTPDKIVCNRFRKKGSLNTDNTNEIKSPQHIIDKANEILDNGDPVKFIFDTHQKLHIGDEILTYTRIAAVGNQSANNTKGIQPSTDGASGKGKSDGDKKFAHLLPKEYVLSGSLSDKVLYYKKDLKPGTYIQSDDVTLTEDLESTIKRASSNFQTNTPHHTLDKDRNVIENEIPPRIVWALNSVDNINSLQLLNRQFCCSVDESSEQDERVLNYQKMCGMFGIQELPETDDVLICREIIRDIKKHLFVVIIPYNYLIEWRDASNRRNFDMFEDMIRGFAVFRYRQRETKDNYIFANFDDFDDAVKLYSKRTEQQGRKLSDAEMKLIKALNSVMIADSKLLQEKTGLSQGRISQLMKGKGKESDSGLLHRVKGLHCERRTEQLEKGNGTATKTIYSLSGFDENQYKESVVWIDDTARTEFLGYYQVITRLLLSKINNGEEVITLITLINNIHSNKRYGNMLNNICSPQKEVIKVITSQPIANDGGNNLVIRGGVITSEVAEYINKHYNHMKKPDSESELSYRIIQAVTDIKIKFSKATKEEIYRIFTDYCKTRGWS